MRRKPPAHYSHSASTKHQRSRHPGRTAAMTAFALAVVLVGGCGSGGDDGTGGGTTTIRFANWAFAEEATREAIQKLVATYEQRRPGVKVRMEPVSFTDLAHKVLLQAQSGNAPDVVQTSGNDMFSLAQAEILQPLERRMDPGYRGSIVRAALELGKVEGVQVAAPWSVAPQGLWYNKAVMAEAGLDPRRPPATMDELLAALAAVKTKTPGVIPFGIDATNRPFGLDTTWSVMKTFGAEPFGGSLATANSPGMKSYLSFMRTLATERYTQVNQKIGYFRPIAATNKVAFLWDGPYLQGVIQKTSGVSDKKFFETWGVTALPRGPSGQSFTVPTDHQLAILKTSKKQQAAWDFIKFLSTSDDGLRYTMTTGSSLPALAKPGGAVARLSDTPIFVAFRSRVLPTVVRPPWGKAYGEIYSPVMAGVQQAMTGSTPIDQVAGQMQTQVQAALR
jgi:multiple sugar transport system substrate-binding protein